MVSQAGTLQSWYVQKNIVDIEIEMGKCDVNFICVTHLMFNVNMFLFFSYF